MEKSVGEVSRRSILVSLAGLFANSRPALCAFQALGAFQHLPLRRKKAPAIATPIFVYFGTDTARGVSKGIYLSRFDAATGRLTEPVLAIAMLRPAYLASGTIHGTSRLLYAVAEGADEATSRVLSFLIDPKTGALAPLNQVSAGSVGPACISLDDTGQAAFVANYAGGMLTSFRILPDGKLSEPVDRLDFHETGRFGIPGPNTIRQDGPHPHSALISPDNRFLLVNDLGKDAIDVFPINPVTASLGEMEPHRFTNSHPGSGPRHVAFHPNGRWVYNINELDSTIDRFLWETTHKGGESQAVLIETAHVTKLLAPEFKGKNTAAELAISPEGYFLYASNRGENTLVVFAIDQATGDLALVQRIACGGKTPRHFTLSPSGGWLVCGNQDSATVTVFKRDRASGKLTGPVQTLSLDSPMFTLFV
jgi:6-phosphogluconolactonase